MAEGENINSPDFIVLLPAGDVPNPDTLIRAFYAAEAYKKAADAKVIISNKITTDLEDSILWRIREELILRGVSEDAVLLEKKAMNTRGHALYIKEAGIGDIGRDKYLLVTSPTHIKRSLLTFRACGFKNVYVLPARTRELKDDIGEHTVMRYRLWQEMETGIKVMRELTALLYYKSRAWI